MQKWNFFSKIRCYHYNLFLFQRQNDCLGQKLPFYIIVFKVEEFLLKSNNAQKITKSGKSSTNSHNFQHFSTKKSKIEN